MFIIGCDYKHNCKLLVEINQLNLYQWNWKRGRESERERRGRYKKKKDKMREKRDIRDYDVLGTVYIVA